MTQLPPRTAATQTHLVAPLYNHLRLQKPTFPLPALKPHLLRPAIIFRCAEGTNARRVGWRAGWLGGWLAGGLRGPRLYSLLVEMSSFHDPNSTDFPDTVRVSFAAASANHQEPQWCSVMPDLRRRNKERIGTKAGMAGRNEGRVDGAGGGCIGCGCSGHCNVLK